MKILIISGFGDVMSGAVKEMLRLGEETALRCIDISEVLTPFIAGWVYTNFTQQYGSYGRCDGAGLDSDAYGAPSRTGKFQHALKGHISLNLNL